MDELIIRFLRGEADPAEEARLEAWRTSPENERYFREVAAIWRATAPASSVPRPTATAVIERAARRRAPLQPRRLAALAAMLVLGLAIGHLRPSGGDTQPRLGIGEFVTGATEMATARLSDGTVVRLAPRSRLRITENAEVREVWLDGKAFFAVSASDRNPFLVRTRAGQAQVLGTRFEVEVRDDDFRVAVVEGRVDVGANQATVSLREGQVARSSGQEPPTVIDHGNVAGLVGWVGAFLAFEATPLKRVAEELERHFDIEVVIEDPSLYDRTVTAWFGEQDVESVLTVICRIADTRCTLRGGVASIQP